MAMRLDHVHRVVDALTQGWDLALALVAAAHCGTAARPEIHPGWPLRRYPNADAGLLRQRSVLFLIA
jgi:hypothetical protein